VSGYPDTVEGYERLNWETFLVRVWQESGTGTWRGQIVHLPGQESAYFATLAQAEAFMARFVTGLDSQGGESAPALE
jgi:hypothetical protein